jgi:oligosaccharide repeat unit polymerase
MINTFIVNSLNLALVLAAVSIVSIRIINKTWVSAAAAYWFGWIFVLIAALVCEYKDWNYAPVTSFACENINQLNFGAFIGFVVGSSLAGKSDSNRYLHKKEKFLWQAEWLLSKFTGKILGIVFVLGIIFFVIQIRQVGFNSDSVTNLRQIYTERQFSLVGWLGTHLSMIASSLIILVGAVDANRGMNIKRLVMFILSAAPLQLGNGGRIFLLSFLLLYLFSFFCMRAVLPLDRALLSRKEALQLVSVLTACLFLFSILGFVRATNLEEFNPLELILGWPASSIAALNSWITAASNSPPTHGVLLFDWPGMFLHKLGIINIYQEKMLLMETTFQFMMKNDSAAVIPRTIIPDLIFDFGAKGVFWGMLYLAICLQFFSIRCAGKGLFWHSLACMCLNSSFMTVQLIIFNPGFCVVLIWAVGLAIYLDLYKGKVSRFIRLAIENNA